MPYVKIHIANMRMIYSRYRTIFSGVVIAFIIAIVLNALNFGLGEREYSAKVERVTLLESTSSSYPAVLYLEIRNEQGKHFYREVSGPVITKGTNIKVDCSKRLITRGLICEYRGKIIIKD